LTLITLVDPALDRVIEVSDTEITVKVFHLFNPEFFSDPGASPGDFHPVNGVSYYEATNFCNWLGRREGLDPGKACYRLLPRHRLAHLLAGPVKLLVDRVAALAHVKILIAGIEEQALQPVTNHRDLGGFRLPTGREFDVMCAARTRTRRYHGDSDVLLGRYAWTFMNSGGTAHRVADKIPNDLGLFDTLGNLQEWCEGPAPQGSANLVSGDLRGGWFGWSPSTEVDRSTSTPNVPLAWKDPTQGFRVVRTITIR
jgi:formylglycine-generating enzyme required for sulfatase activity